MIEYYKNKSLESLFYVDENGLVCQEEWKDIPDYEGLYQASDLGRIKSLSRYVKNALGYFWTKEIILSQCYSNSKKIYLGVTLYKEGVKTKFEMHPLIGITFLNHTPCGHEKIVDHIKNKEKLNNQLSNLQIITGRHNTSKDKVGFTSDFTGVYFHKIHKKWCATISINHKTIHLGIFSLEKDASDAYQLALSNWENLGIEPSKKIFSSQYKGVIWDKTKNKWRANIETLKKKKHLGYFDNEYDAHLAYQKALLEKNKPSD